MHERSILVTGCSSGIGRCVALALRERGYRVYATARKSEDLAQLEDAGLEAIELDASDPVSVSAAVDETLSRTGGTLYGLFNNGAYGQPGAIEDLTRDVLREQFETNFFGWHDLTRQLLPVMRRAGLRPHHPEQLGTGLCRPGLPRRLQRQQVCPRRFVRHAAPGTQRNQHLPGSY